MIQLNLLRHQTQKFALSPTHKIENNTSKTTIQKNKRRTPETHTCQILSHKNALFYQLGMIKGTGDGYVYDAWYNGGNYIEIYASDAEFAELVRTQINYNV